MIACGIIATTPGRSILFIYLFYLFLTERGRVAKKLQLKRQLIRGTKMRRTRKLGILWNRYALSFHVWTPVRFSRLSISVGNRRASEAEQRRTLKANGLITDVASPLCCDDRNPSPILVDKYMASLNIWSRIGHCEIFFVLFVMKVGYNLTESQGKHTPRHEQYWPLYKCFGRTILLVRKKNRHSAIATTCAKLYVDAKMTLNEIPCICTTRWTNTRGKVIWPKISGKELANCIRPTFRRLWVEKTLMLSTAKQRSVVPRYHVKLRRISS